MRSARQEDGFNTTAASAIFPAGRGSGDYHRFRAFLEAVCGIDLGENKAYLVENRLAALSGELGTLSLGQLVRELERDAGGRLTQKVVDAMTTHETRWFRDVIPYRILAQALLPELAIRHEVIRIWCAGCASGEEAYSISMVIADLAQTLTPKLSRTCEVLASDVSERILGIARRGTYSDAAVARGLSPERRDRYLAWDNGAWRVTSAVRERVGFRKVNLLDEFSDLGAFQIIFCRNVLIYFSPARKYDILARLRAVLAPGGYLFLGASEVVPRELAGLELVRYGRGFVYRKV